MSFPVPFPPNSRVVAYLRDSGGEDQDLSVAQQQVFIKDWCIQNNLVLTAIFADVATPGSSTIGRDQFRKLINHFHDPDCTDAGVILWKFSRFSRDMDDAMFYRADLRRRGYTVHSIQDNIPDTTDGRIYEALIDWMNNKFLEDLSMDVKRGLHHLVTTYGAVPGVAPRGFLREPVAIGSRRDGTPHTAHRWSPDPEKWDLCLQAWTMRAQGISLHKIHNELPIFASSRCFADFFKNRIYLGELHYGDLVIQDYVQPLITREIWDAVQELNARNSAKHAPLKRAINPRHPRRENSSFVLSGLLHCPRCGSVMNGMSVRSKKSGVYEYYHCSNAHSKFECDARRIPKATIENEVIEKIIEYVLDPRVMQERDKALADSHVGSLEKVNREIAHVALKLKNVERKLVNLAERISEADHPSPTLMQYINDLERKKNELNQEHDRMKSIQKKETVIISDPVDIEKLAKQFAYALTDDALDKRREAIRLIVHRVAAERDGEFVRGIVHFYNPTDKKGFMSITGSPKESPALRHKTFTFEFCAKIKRNLNPVTP